MWGLLKIQAPAAWDLFRGSPDTVIAVTDTGIDYEHPDLIDNLWINPGETPDNGIDDDGNGYIDDVMGWNFVDDNNDPFDNHNHGTHTAGTIGAVGNNGVGVAGVMWQAKIMPLKICSGFTCSLTAAVRAIDYAIQNGAMAINASWGGGSGSEALKDAIGRAEDAGLLFIAAAGNNGRDIDDSIRSYYPAAYDNENIIAVAATDETDALTSSSNYGANTVHLAAPGSNIISTVRNGEYGTLSGTSMAAPHVTGTVGLLLGWNTKLTAADVKSIILDSVDPIPGLQDKTRTGGRLNLLRALEMAQ
jgi:subtilisin family serine protease